MIRRLPFAALIALALPLAASPADEARPDKLPAKYQPHVDKGLEWLAKQQKKDGRWSTKDGKHAIAITSLAGLALLAEGSKPGEGKYGKEIDNAVPYLIDRTYKTGLISTPGETKNCMFGHGFAMLFLSQAYSKETNVGFRRELLSVLTRAVSLTRVAQMRNGGWTYGLAHQSNEEYDVGNVTVVQLRALLAARQAGIPDTEETIAKGMKYLEDNTVVTTKDAKDGLREEAGVRFSTWTPAFRPYLTPAALACAHSGDCSRELRLRWLNYCHHNVPMKKPDADEVYCWDYAHYYLAQVVYRLGEDGHSKLRPDLAEFEKANPDKQVLLKWSRYREALFDFICSQQEKEGCWNQKGLGLLSCAPCPNGGDRVYATAVCLIILQLDNAKLPIFQR